MAKMFREYFIHKIAQPNGDHEVHGEDCLQLPAPAQRLSLGLFTTCRDAMPMAKKAYATANGCNYCAYLCHSTN